MNAPVLWKVTCQEDKYPGLWQRWFKDHLVAVGYPPNWLREIESKNTKEWRGGWKRVKNRLSEIQIGHLIVVQLPGRRIGRLAQVIKKRIEDAQWEPTVPPSEDEPEGLLGRRILVKWDFLSGPDSPELVVQLPKDFKLNHGEWLQPLARIHRESFIQEFEQVMANPKNWIRLQALHGGVAVHPHRLEDGLLPQPNKSVTSTKLAKNRVRRQRTRRQPKRIELVDQPESHQLDYKIQTKRQIIQAKRIEAGLLEGYCQWLKHRDRKLVLAKYGRLQCDGYEEQSRNLIEAKASTDREHVRMAVGQLLDYAFQGKKKLGSPNMGILLPEKLNPRIEKWLLSLSISIIWKDGESFFDNANGQFGGLPATPVPNSERRT
jgi:hypothetical protein